MFIRSLLFVLLPLLACAQVESGGERGILTPAVSPKPRINGPKVYGVRPGHPFLYLIPATGERPMKFSARTLPKGLRLDSSTGVIAGRIKKAGDYSVMLTAA